MPGYDAIMTDWNASKHTDAPFGYCDECGTALMDHRDQCLKGDACEIEPEALLWCPRCEDFTLWGVVQPRPVE